MDDAQLRDEQACARLMLRIGYFADRHDIDGFVALFAADGTIVRAGGETIGHAAIRDSMTARSRARVTRHLLTPPMIELTGADTARGTCYFTMYDGLAADRDDKGELPLRAPVVIGDYEQTYRRIDGDWKIASHRIVATLRPSPPPAA